MTYLYFTHTCHYIWPHLTFSSDTILTRMVTELNSDQDVTVGYCQQDNLTFSTFALVHWLWFFQHNILSSPRLTLAITLHNYFEDPVPDISTKSI